MNTIQTTFKIIDIHSHILMGMDHGAKSFDESKKMLDNAKENGIKSIVCTPHHHYDNTLYNKYFLRLKRYAKKQGIEIYKGNELMLSDDIIDELREKRVNTLNSSNYILIETKRKTTYSFKKIKYLLQELIDYNYKVIVAHPELINNAFKNKKELLELRKMGVLFQIDASSFYDNRKYQNRIKKLFKLNLVDFVSSDIHWFKNDYHDLIKLYNYLFKKYDNKFVKKIFYDNPLKVINNKKIKFTIN